MRKIRLWINELRKRGEENIDVRNLIVESVSGGSSGFDEFPEQRGSIGTFVEFENESNPL